MYGLSGAVPESAFLCVVLAAVAVVIIYSVVYSLFQSKRLKKLVLEDSLTGLLSLEGLEVQCQRMFHLHHDESFLLTEFNVRDFAFVNRLYGSEKGDEILKSLADVLRDEFAGKKNTVVARGYADNFYVVTLVEDNEDSALVQMELFQSNLQEHVGQVQNVHIILKSGSIICRRDGDAAIDFKDMVSRAGYARHSTQDSIVENFAVYDESMQNQHENEEKIENTIEDAIHKQELLVMYQPKMNLQTGKIEGAEALVRWKGENNVLIPPNVFIPVLERNGMVGILDHYVYNRVFKFMNRLQRENVPLVRISMNMSRLNHNTLEFVNELDILRERYEIDRQYVELEIEERFAGAGDDFLKDLIHRLHATGYMVSMDDFGSGQSSLNMLSEMPVDVVKIDQRFLMQAEYSQESRIILSYMVRMVNELGKESLCEGVETETHVQLLRDMGCRLAQGYYYSKPITEDEFKQFILDHI